MIIATHSQKVVEWVDRVFNIEDGILVELKSSEAMKRLVS